MKTLIDIKMKLLLNRTTALSVNKPHTSRLTKRSSALVKTSLLSVTSKRDLFQQKIVFISAQYFC